MPLPHNLLSCSCRRLRQRLAWNWITCYTVVSPGGVKEIAALQSAGLRVDSPQGHEGEGTTSVAAFFENAYIELMWLDSMVSVTPEHAATVQQFREAASWRVSRHSPFGFGLRRLPGETREFDFPIKHEPAPWIEPGAAYEILNQPADALAADFFVVPGAPRYRIGSVASGSARPSSSIIPAAGTKSRWCGCTAPWNSSRAPSRGFARPAWKHELRPSRSSRFSLTAAFIARGQTCVRCCRSCWSVEMRGGEMLDLSRKLTRRDDSRWKGHRRASRPRPAYARPANSRVSVWTLTFSPSLMKSGTRISRPVSSRASFVTPPLAVSPRTPGSV